MLRRVFRAVLPFAAEWEFEQWTRFLWTTLAVVACAGVAVPIAGFAHTTSALLVGVGVIVGVPVSITALVAGLGFVLALPMLLFSDEAIAKLAIEPAERFLRSYCAWLNRRGPIVWGIMVGIFTMGCIFHSIERASAPLAERPDSWQDTR